MIRVGRADENGQIEKLARQAGRGFHCRDGEIDPGEARPDPGEAFGQPELREGRQGGNVKVGLWPEVAERVGGVRQPVKGEGEPWQEVGPCGGERDPLRVAAKEGRARPAFERLHVLRDRPRRDVQLFRRGHETDMARGGLEGAHGVQGRSLGALGCDAHGFSLSFSTPRNSISALRCHGVRGHPVPNGGS